MANANLKSYLINTALQDVVGECREKLQLLDPSLMRTEGQQLCVEGLIEIQSKYYV